MSNKSIGSKTLKAGAALLAVGAGVAALNAKNKNGTEKKKIKEIQVEMSEREQGTSSFNVGHTIRYMCRMIISIFFIQPFRKRK